MKTVDFRQVDWGRPVEEVLEGINSDGGEQLKGVVKATELEISSWYFLNGLPARLLLVLDDKAGEELDLTWTTEKGVRYATQDDSIVVEILVR